MSIDQTPRATMHEYNGTKIRSTQGGDMAPFSSAQLYAPPTPLILVGHRATHPTYYLLI